MNAYFPTKKYFYRKTINICAIKSLTSINNTVEEKKFHESLVILCYRLMRVFFCYEIKKMPPDIKLDTSVTYSAMKLYHSSDTDIFRILA